MRRMVGRSRLISGVGLGLLSVASVTLAASAARGEGVRRNGVMFDAPCVFQVLVSAIDARVGCDAATLPPAGDGMIRPAHFSVCAVIVSIQQMWEIRCSRLGGLHGP